MWIYSKYITTKKGNRIYPKDASCFCFLVDDERPDNTSANKPQKDFKADTRNT